METKPKVAWNPAWKAKCNGEYALGTPCEGTHKVYKSVGGITIARLCDVHKEGYTGGGKVMKLYKGPLPDSNSKPKKPAKKSTKLKRAAVVKSCPTERCSLYGKSPAKWHTHCRVCDTKLKETKKELEVAKMRWWQILEHLAKVSGRIMLVGPPGTGKSRTAELICGNAQRLTMTEGTAVEDLLGMFHLVKGETVWKDGPAARAMRSGTALILDEIDKYSPEVGSLLYALLDDDPQVTLPSGEHLKAAAGYCVIATSNANVSALPEAILDRMEAVIVAAEPHPAAMAHLKQEEVAAVTAHYQKKVNASAWQWTGSATLRRMRAYAKFRKEAADLADVVVAEVTFGKNGKEILSVLATAARTGKEGL